ncbi:hypothetical protein LQV05_004138 [Cryptococcus neoformans]|nr:hypothetical protein J007_01169 [Cryptococcus neoformans var. grubii]OXC63887.1 hypothetical protein C358_01171 [Cryptococcus neoformans var. grubii MW-RSA852]UOH81467.1 hypothetical protein LQV05_004138 [Cryptococcus neoformans]
MSFRAPLVRARLPQAVFSRHAPLSTVSRALPAPVTLKTSGLRNTLFARAFTSSPISKLEASLPLRDGGMEEAPHSGINVDKPVRMDTQPPPEPGADFNVVMIGAGNIMFGSDEGPWNHSFRFEHKLGPRLKVTALIDPSIERAEKVLDGKRQSFVESAYKDTKVYKTIEDYHADLKNQGVQDPNAIVVGCPPAYRGGTTKGRDLEIQMLKLFPKTAYFIEKPVGTDTVEAAKEVTQKLIENGNIVSVGYMLRYLQCVQKMKQIIHENNLTVMATNARYSCAYEAIAKPAWWNKAIDMGPVIEQGTHFCDLSRYFGGDVDMNSIAARSVEWYEEPGKLSKIPIDESKIDEDLRIPRLTSAIWKYENGAVGSFQHAVALQGSAYSCELEVWADGYHMRLVDPYNSPSLFVRRPGDDHEERHSYTDDDPFFSEVSSFIDCIEGGPDPHILSSFEDATKSYELTWAIRMATEGSRKLKA